MITAFVPTEFFGIIESVVAKRGRAGMHGKNGRSGIKLEMRMHLYNSFLSTQAPVRFQEYRVRYKNEHIKWNGKATKVSREPD